MFKAHDSDIIKDWIQNINEHIKVATELQQAASPTTLIMQNKFWKYDTISELEFLDKADTGDLLLFRTKQNQLGPRITRTLTSSNFDHVAMILKFE